MEESDFTLSVVMSFLVRAATACPLPPLRGGVLSGLNLYHLSYRQVTAGGVADSEGSRLGDTDDLTVAFLLW